MTTQHIVNWSEPLPRLPLDVLDVPTILQEVGYETKYKSLYVHLKRLEESRRAFLEVQEEQKENDQKRPRKISFKCKKPSTYRKLSPSSVAELTTKFNEMLEKNEQPKLSKLVKRVNSQREEPGKKVIRKPSVKLKPKLDEKFSTDKRRARYKLGDVPKFSYLGNCEEPQKTSDDKEPFNSGTVRATIEIFERRSSQCSPDGEEKLFKNVPKPKVPERNPNIKVKDMVVKDGIRKLKVFEKRFYNSQESNDSSGSDTSEGDIKTSVALKNTRNSLLNQETQLLEPSLKVYPQSNFLVNEEQTVYHSEETIFAKKLSLEDEPSDPAEHSVQSALESNDHTFPEKTNIPDSHYLDCSSNIANIAVVIEEPTSIPDSHTEETKTELDEVQILSIPLVMPRRCDSMYETMTLRKISPPSNLRTSRSEGAVSAEPVPNSSFLWRRKSHTLDDKSRAPPAVPPRPSSLHLKPHTPPKTIFKKKMPLPEEEEESYEELQSDDHSYEYCRSPSKYEDLEQKSDDGYECFDTTPTKERIYETLPPSQNETPPTDSQEEIYETLPSPRQDVPPPLPKRKETSSIDIDDVYEILPSPAAPQKESAPPLFARRQGQEEPLPPRPPSRDSYCTIQNDSNCYESIYSSAKREVEVSNNYESIYGGQKHDWEFASNRDSLVSSDQQSNSLYSRSLLGWAHEEANVYNGKASSDLSGSSDKSDEWIDISDDEHAKGLGFVIVRERQRNKKASGWSQKIRDQWNKSHSSDREQGDSGSDHHYESLYLQYQDNEDFDSFDSDTESESSFIKPSQSDNIDNCQLPDPPTQSYGFSRLAVSAGKHMKKLRRNWSLTKNDITKSLSRMAKRKSRTDLTTIETKAKEKPSVQQPRVISSPILQYQNSALSSVTQELKMRQDSQQPAVYQSLPISRESFEPEERPRSNTLTKKTFLNKFRRSMSSINTETAELAPSLSHKPKSTFYLTESIDVDEKNAIKTNENLSGSPTAVRRSRTISQRPQSPPPPIPVDANQNIDSKSRYSKRSTSWYAECGLFRNVETTPMQNLNRRPNTSWYAEIGLYQTSTSTPSTSSTENSGSTSNLTAKSPEPDSLTEIKDNEDYYNLKNENDYYNHSLSSYKSDTTIEFTNGTDIQLRLQDEPLYQFYDAAVLESVCQDGTTELDYDGYEEVGDTSNSDSDGRLSRPSAMQLITPTKNGVTVARTLWCEIPEVVQSAVLSTLSSHQKKLQEAKFEMMTSEASYLNSLNVLTDHFISNFTNSDLLTYEEKNVLFGRIPAVKRCSEKLLSDMEKCWQENILLHGICDVILKHAEENFYAYVSYCENQILLDSTLRKIKDRTAPHELLKQLECCSACQSLSLYSFLMLPMQRITRWPLLVDAVLKRLSPQDDEYMSCQYTLATINKIVMQCNEAARRMERETEMKRIASQIEFPKNIPVLKLASGSRWLVRSGLLTQMQARADDTKLTFGKRFSKVPLHLFLFNDLLLITKPRSDDCFVVLHYCYRSYIELNVNDIVSSLPSKDTQGRYLIFLTILENHEGKTVEMLLSCSSETDKERWIEALSSPRSEDPNETLYERWDCPQVTAIHSYGADQPDELALSRGDIVNVTRKMADGWYHGERIRDGRIGWFPANYTVEVANPHVRARNLKQRYRLLAFSENYLKSK